MTHKTLHSTTDTNQTIPKHFQSSPSEWRELAVMENIQNDWLPKISNPAANVSPLSRTRAIGQIPSHYNNNHEVVGIPGRTTFIST